MEEEIAKHTGAADRSQITWLCRYYIRLYPRNIFLKFQNRVKKSSLTISHPTQTRSVNSILHHIYLDTIDMEMGHNIPNLADAIAEKYGAPV